MRRIRSLGSVRAISLDRDKILEKLREVSRQGLDQFPEIGEVRLIGSLASGTHTGMSDVDLVVSVGRVPRNSVEAAMPYFDFFCSRIPLALDLFLTDPQRSFEMDKTLKEGILLASRQSGQ